MKFPRSVRILKGQWDAVPFLCVLFPLCFFMLFGSYLVLPPGVAVELPTVTDGMRLDTAQPRVLLALDRQGRLYLDNQYVPESDVVRRLAERRARLVESPVVLVHADASVSHAQLIRVGDLARQAGLDRIFFVARAQP
jgi:biopolymer transport protein ExbD